MRTLKLALVYTGLFITSLNPLFAGTPEKPIGKVIEASGKVWVIRNSDLKTKVPIQANSALYQRDVLLTDGGSKAQLILGDKEAALLVKEKSILQFLRDKNGGWFIDLNQGLLLTHVKPKPNVRPRFHVKTRAAVMGVRGTVFFIKEEPNKDTFLCTCQGLVSVDDKVLILGKHHDAPKWIQPPNSGNPGKQVLASRLKTAEMGNDHSDTEGSALVKLLEAGK